ncbi:hypothetical protein LA080_014342 [Diaporthe eres]|uniref:F-box domain-containing protein n=1 Tax=Diaporthe vaccinii TaxID=105482 RepID=A0ABR4F1R8_9PEZI|nr:hypothetical protein LA080_014342 [Diaporthe eres]
MASQSDNEERNTPSNTIVSRLLTVLPVETRLQIYQDVFRGSRARLISINPRTPQGKAFALRPSHHHQLLLVCPQIYAEALSTYWSSTIIDSALNPPFEFGDFSEVLRAIPVFARPVIREIRCKGFRESVPGLNFRQFVDRFDKIETLVMEPAFTYVSRRYYDQTDWSANFVINEARLKLRRQLAAVFGFDDMSNIRVLQRIQFPVVIRGRDSQIRLAARDRYYPAKVFFVNHFKGLVYEGTVDTPDEAGFQEVL